jgi:hypothetical protein
MAVRADLHFSFTHRIAKCCLMTPDFWGARNGQGPSIFIEPCPDPSQANPGSAAGARSRP